MPDLTRAEQAAAEALWNHWTPIHGDPELSIEDFYDEARTAATAAEPHHTIAALEEAATALDQLAALKSRETRGTTPGPYIVAGIQVAAQALFDEIRALRSDIEGTTTNA